MTKAEAPDNRNIYQRLHAVMAEVSYVQKDKKIDAGQRGYMVVTHDAVTSKVRPVLVKHGVMYYPQNLKHAQDGNRTEVSMDVVFVNVAHPDDRVAVPTFGYGIDQGDKGPGKAVSYAIKYALLKALGLETGEDADNDAEVKHTPSDDGLPKVKNGPGVSKARTWVAEFIRDAMACENGEAFMELCTGTRTHWIKICGVYPGLWAGPDGSGLRGEAQKVATIMQCRAGFDAFVKDVETAAEELKQPQAAE